MSQRIICILLCSENSFRALVEAFPEVQFIVATHSPFVVSSVKSASVYAFDVEEFAVDSDVSYDLSSARNAVIAVPIDLTDRTTASEVLRQVLGVPVSVPIWAERELEEVVQSHGSHGFAAEDIRSLHAKLAERGLGEFLPDAVSRALERNAEADEK